MKKVRFKLIGLVTLLLWALAGFSCSKGGDDNGEGPSGGKIPDYQARTWDGQKRAGVYYEIFVRSFADSNGDGIGDLQGITDKLPYLQDLGVSGIWLTPIHPSPSYHGYDVEDYTAINPQFGTMADFDRMLAKAHSLDIDVILDFVVNHTSKTHPWFTSACTSTSSPTRDYFLFAQGSRVAAEIAAGNVPMVKTYNDWQWHTVPSGTTNYKYYGEFSDWMPDLNYHAVEEAENSPAFQAICRDAKFWLDKGVDGFRLDAVKHIYQDENSDENPRFLKKFHQELQKTKPDVYLVGEALSESNKVAPYYAGLPAMFEFSGWWEMEAAINNGTIRDYPKNLLYYRNMYSQYNRNFIQATKLSNHDEDRTRSKLGDNIAKCKMAAALLMTVAGSPYVYYGEEIGMRGMKTGGDENVREPFLWDYLLHDPYRTTWMVPKNSTDSYVTDATRQLQDPNSLLNTYKDLIRLRNTYPALATGEMSMPSWLGNLDGQVTAFYRTEGSEKLLVIHNASGYSSTVTVPETLKQAVAGFGDIRITEEKAGSLTLKMPAMSTFICQL